MTDDRSAFTIAEFCERNAISPALFNKLRNSGRGPKLMYLERAIRITAEAERLWKLARENPGKKEQALIARQRRERSRRATIAGNAAAASPKHVSKRHKKGKR
jgi:hypothetical protein